MTIQRNLNKWVNGDASRKDVQRTIEELDQRLSKFEQMLSLIKGSNGNGNAIGLSAQQRLDVLGLVAARSSAVIGQEVVDPLVVGLPTGNGTVTSFTAGDLSPLFTTTENTPTTTPALVFSQIAQSRNTIFAGPVSGGAANPAFRALTSADVPPLNVITITFADSPYTLTDANDVVLVDATGGNVTINLSNPTTARAKAYYFKLIDGSGNQMILSSAAKIDNAGTQATATQYVAFTVIPDATGATWWNL